MDTTPFGSPVAPAPAAPPTAAGAASTPWTRSPLVLGCAGLGVLALAAAAVVLTSGEDAATTAAPLVPAATATPTTAPTTAPTTEPGASVVPAVADGRNPFFALVAGRSAGAPSGAAAATTGVAARTGAAAATGAAGGGARSVRVVPGPTVTREVEVEVPVPGPTVTQQVPAPPAPTEPVVVTYLGPDAKAPGSSVFRLAGGGSSVDGTLAPGEALAESGPLAWLVFTRIGDDGHAVVTGGTKTYDLAQGTGVPLV